MRSRGKSVFDIPRHSKLRTAGWTKEATTLKENWGRHSAQRVSKGQRGQKRETIRYKARTGTFKGCSNKALRQAEIKH